MYSRWIFRLAGIYGLLLLVPHYFLERRIGEETPPEITHPEYFYGFVGVGVAWQIAFLVIGSDPNRYRLMMIPAIIEKLSFGFAALALYYHNRLPGTVLFFGCIDLLLGALFAIALWRMLAKIAPPSAAPLQ